MLSLNDRMGGSTVFSKIDLVKAYHQIPIAEADIPKTVAPFGLWEFLCMAFGLRNAAQALQRLKDNILMGLGNVFSFLNDDGVFSKSREQHWTHLHALLAILAANGLAINLEKCMLTVSELNFLGHRCMLTVSELNFLGHRISAASIVALWDNVQLNLDFPKPADCKALQRFLGMMNFYRPLTAALSSNPKALPWKPDMETAFTATKAALVAAVPLAHLLPKAFLALATDVSDTHVGVVLQQQVGQHWQLLGFFSKKLSKPR
jgi:hypothetical protein